MRLKMLIDVNELETAYSSEFIDDIPGKILMNRKFIHLHVLGPKNTHFLKIVVL